MCRPAVPGLAAFRLSLPLPKEMQERRDLGGAALRVFVPWAGNLRRGAGSDSSSSGLYRFMNNLRILVGIVGSSRLYRPHGKGVSGLAGLQCKFR